MQMFQTLVESGREAQRTGSLDEAVAHFESALSLLPMASDVLARAEVLRWVGNVHAERGDLEDAASAFHASRIAAGCAGAVDQEAAALICLANIDMRRGNLEEAAEGFLKARRITERAGWYARRTGQEKVLDS